MISLVLMDITETITQLIDKGIPPLEGFYKSQQKDI